jgi:hypothetical protein
MFSKTVLTHSLYSLVLMSFSNEANANCFTMPPKVVKISKWAFSLPNVESSSYIHESHICPNGYTLDSQYSHIVTSMTTSTIFDLSIYGYSVCCEENLTSYYTRISGKNSTNIHI